MKKTTRLGALLLLGLLGLSSCRGKDDVLPNLEKIVKEKGKKKENKIYVPTIGNAFLQRYSPKGTADIDKKGVVKWSDPKTTVYIFFKVGKTGKLNVSLKGLVPYDGESVINVAVGYHEDFDKTKQEKAVTISGSGLAEHSVGDFDITKAGYVRMALQGVSKTSDYFADITDIVISGPATEGENMFANKEELFLDSRRGPKGTLRYETPKNEDISFFYSEVLIPKDKDIYGASFVVNGFDDGVLLLKSDVVGNDNRRVSFVINGVTDSRGVMVNKKNDDAIIEETGNRRGKRAYLKYNWKAGETYKFLVKADPKKGATDYMAYFLPPNESQWILIASFKKLNSENYLKGLYSLIECLNPYNGVSPRKAIHKNIWVKDKRENWHNISKAEFDVDEVYRQKQRTDVEAGTKDNGFTLESGGFFIPTVQPKTVLSIKPETKTPEGVFFKIP